MIVAYIYLIGLILVFVGSFGYAMYQHYVKGIKNHNIPINSKKSYQYHLLLGATWPILVIVFLWGGFKNLYRELKK